MARNDGLDKLSYAELLDLQERVKVALVDRKVDEARQVKEKLQALASKSGFSLSELFGGKRGGRKGTVAVKYRNPKDSSQTWTGRGRRPAWLVDAVKKGAKLERFLV